MKRVSVYFSSLGEIYRLLTKNKKINFLPDRVNIWRAELPSIKLYIVLPRELVYSLENDAVRCACVMLLVFTPTRLCPQTSIRTGG